MDSRDEKALIPHADCPVCNAASSDLREASYPELESFAIQGVFDCKVVRVFDGDTLWIAIRTFEKTTMTSSVTRVNCRLLGIDAPEIPHAHTNAMNAESVAAFATRDRLVELVTDVTLKERDEHTNTSGLEMPSLTSTQLQAKLDRNTLVLRQGLTLSRGTDKYGRYLARLRTKDGRDVSSVLLEEGLAVPYGK